MRVAIFVSACIFSLWAYADNNESQDLSQLLHDARCVPVLENGQVTKYDCNHSKGTGSKFQKLGIKRGDVVKSVDGQPVDSPEKAMELYNQIRETSQVEVESADVQ